MLNRLISKSLEASPKSVLLLGPRQVGKSTLIRTLSPDLEINLANQSEYLAFSSNPGLLEQKLKAFLPGGGKFEQQFTVFIDEVQKLTTLLNTVQSLLDRPDKWGNLKFFLSGSSARKLRRGGANLLPGRIFTFQLGPLAGNELKYNVDIKKGLEMGFLPEPYLSNERKFQEKLLESYAATYLTEEIQAEALTRNLEGFSRFIFVAAENSGKVLDLSKVSTKARVSRQSCVRFFEILEDTLVARKVLPCTYTEGADLVKHPKFFFFDQGVLNGILGNFVASSDRIGLLAEHLVFNQLIQSAQSKDERIEISSFRTRGGLEIDFIIKLRNHVWAIEVKASSNLTAGDIRPLREFSRYIGENYTPVVVTMDDQEKRIEDTWVLPIQKLLREMDL